MNKLVFIRSRQCSAVVFLYFSVGSQRRILSPNGITAPTD